LVLEAAHPLQDSRDRDGSPLQKELARKQGAVELGLSKDARCGHEPECRDGAAVEGWFVRS
jgi:hypothetical protein